MKHEAKIMFYRPIIIKVVVEHVNNLMSF